MHSIWRRLVSVLFIAVLGLVSCQNPLTSNNTFPEALTIGTLAHELNGLLYVAQDQGYFASQGLAVTLKTYDTGIDTADAAMAGDVDLAGVTEFVLVGRGFRGDPLRTIATIAKSEDQYVIARADRGILQAADLRGKSVGVPRQTVSEFYLGRFLDLHGMSIQQVRLVDLKPAETVNAMAAGQVDAVVAWEPFASRIRDESSGNLLSWPAQSSQVLYWNIVGTDQWLKQRPGTVTRLLAALAQAESFVRLHPDQAKKIVAKVLHYDDAYMNYIFPNHSYALALDQSLILAMEDEARWLIRNDLAAGPAMPDFLQNVYLDGLTAVKPSAVNIIH